MASELKLVGAPQPGSIVDVVLGVRSPEPNRCVVMAVRAGAAACALLGGWALRFAHPPEAQRRVSTRPPVEISLSEPAHVAPVPTVLREPPARMPVARQPRVPHVIPRVASAPAPAAQAAAVVAREPSSPADLTGDAFVVGVASVYGGGVTSPQGVSAVPGQGRDVSATRGLAAGGGGGGRSAPIGLASESWSCPWPEEAASLPIDDETVVIRVVVRPNGTAESVAIVSDPGHGFGAAAASCALRTQFAPARAADGEPVRATSAPIRVRFTR